MLEDENDSKQKGMVKSTMLGLGGCPKGQMRVFFPYKHSYICSICIETNTDVVVESCYVFS